MAQGFVNAMGGSRKTGRGMMRADGTTLNGTGLTKASRVPVSTGNKQGLLTGDKKQK